MKNKNKLQTGDKVFYHSKTITSIEEVIEVDKKLQQVKLSNQAIINRIPDSLGNYQKLIGKDEAEILKLTPELERIYQAIIARKTFIAMDFRIKNRLIQQQDYRQWDHQYIDNMIQASKLIKELNNLVQ